MEENNFKWNNWQRIKLENTQAAHAAQYQKSKNPIKVGRKPKQTVLQSRYTNGQQTHEKIYNTTRY